MSNAAETCVFCRIVAGTIPATIVGENADAIAFRDLAPQAPVHLLVVPRAHTPSLATATDAAALAGVLSLVREVAAAHGVAEAGYRVVTNVGADGGQTVPHLHFHVLGGRALHWPPG